MVKGYIVINEDLCKGCRLCVPVCPFDLIHIGDHYNSKGYRPAEMKDPQQQCTGCTLCATICPDAVITVFRQTNRHVSLNDKPSQKKVA